MSQALTEVLKRENQNLKDAGLYRFELPLDSPQKSLVKTGDRELVNLASSNYLGLANDPSIKKAVKLAIDRYGVGLSAPRIQTGSQTHHRELEQKIADFLGAEAAITFASGYHANTGVFEPLFGDRDFLFLDVRAHASLADGIRLAGARTRPYRHRDLEDLEDRLKRSRSARFRVIVTDGVFPIDGTLAPLDGICHLATRYDAMVIISDAQGIGVLGERGRGTGEHFRVTSQLTLLTGSFNCALGGGGGGFVVGSKALIEWLRQKSRPYLISSALPPASVAAAFEALRLVDAEANARVRLRENVERTREELEAGGLRVHGGEHAILSIHVGHALNAQKMIDVLFDEGIFAVGFCHPVVPEGEARVRLQVSAKHTKSSLARVAQTCIAAKRQFPVD